MGNALVNRRLLVALALVLVLAATYWLREREQAPAPVVHGQPSDADYEMNGFRLTRYDEAGQVHYTVDARHLAHFPSAKLARLEQPTAVFFRAGEPRWVLQASQGEMADAGDQARFPGQVNMSNVVGTQADALQLFTEDVRLDLAARRATTDHPVRAEHGSGSWLTAQGMAVDLAGSRLELNSKVRMAYEVSP